MRAVAGLEGLQRGAKAVASAAARVVAKVNPDVWREFGYVTLSGYSLLLPRAEPIIPREPDGFAPVVLVHGLGGNRGAWWPLRLFLMLSGHRRIYAFGYSNGDVRGLAEAFEGFVNGVLEVTGERQADLVTHSLGGIVSRYAIQRLGLRDKVRTLVTMAAMHYGTYAAHYANTELTKALRPESDLIRDLNSDGPERYPSRFVSIGSNRDVYVVPAQSMRHPFAENIFVPGVSHAEYLVSPRVFRVVDSVLDPL
jgi:triacylglycerol lipase